MQGGGAPRYWQASSQLIQSMLAKPQMPKKLPASSALSAAKPVEAQNHAQRTGHGTVVAFVCTCGDHHALSGLPTQTHSNINMEQATLSSLQAARLQRACRQPQHALVKLPICDVAEVG